VAGLLDRLDDGLDVERLDRAQVDDFGFDAVLGLELFCGNEGLADAAGEGDNGEVLAGALDLGFAELSLLELSLTDGRKMGRTGITKSSF
jgi:hypothetical protein